MFSTMIFRNSRQSLSKRVDAMLIFDGFHILLAADAGGQVYKLNLVRK